MKAQALFYSPTYIPFILQSATTFSKNTELSLKKDTYEQKRWLAPVKTYFPTNASGKKPLIQSKSESIPVSDT